MVVGWNPPPQGLVNVNVDVALFLGIDVVGVGIMLRNHHGEFIAAKAIQKHHVSSPHPVELYAAPEGLLFARELGIRSVCLEGDAKVVFDNIKSGRQDLTYNRSILKDIYMCCSWSYRFDCDSISKDSNKVADCLANQVKVGLCGSWMKIPLDHILNLLSVDLALNKFVFMSKKKFC